MPIVRSHHSFDDHFTQIPNAWVRDNRLSLRARGLLVQLMSHRAGWSVSLKSLANDNNCGIDSIRSSVNELLTVGYLERSEARGRGENGQLSDYTYTTKDPALDSPTLEKPTLDNPTPKKNILKEEQDTRTVNRQDELDDAFNEFWKFFPRKQYKQQVQKTFTKVVTRKKDPVPVSVLIDGARRLAADPNLPAKEFIPNGERWLNQGGWENEPYPARERSKDELEALRKAEADRKRELELQAAAKRREEAKAAEEEVKRNPPKRCEHDRVAVMCQVCSRQ